MSPRTIVVTGGASGVGLAIAQRAVAEGWNTIVVDRQEPLGEIDARVVRCDLKDADATHDALERIVREEGQVDALVASSGGMLGGPFDSRQAEEWVERMTTDVATVLRAVRLLLPALRRAAEARGVADIIVIGSIASDVAFEHAAVYGATAAARNALGEQLRVELRGDRVRSRTIAIGYVETAATKGRDIPALTEQIAAAPLHPEDIVTIVHHQLNLPQDVIVRDIEVVPTAQGWA